MSQVNRVSKREEEQEETYKSYYEMLFVSLTIGLSYVYVGYMAAYLNSINFDDLRVIFDIRFDRAEAQGLLTGCIPVFAGVGAWHSQFVIDRFGRREGLLKVNAIIITSTLLLQIPSFWVLLLARSVQGFCVGLIGSMAGIYGKELIPQQLCAPMSSLDHGLGGLGIMISFLITYLSSLSLPAEIYWRITFGFPIVLIGAQTILLLYMYPHQSPKYLLIVEREDYARRVIQHIYKREHAEIVLERIKKDLQPVQDELDQASKNQLEVEMQQIDKDQRLSRLQKKLIKHQKTCATNKMAVYTALHLAFLNKMTGLGIAISYFGEILLMVRPEYEKTAPVFLHLAAFICTLVDMKLFRSHGRVPIYQSGLFGMSITVFLIAFFFNYPSIFGGYMIIFLIFVFRCIYNLSIGPLTSVIISDIVQPNILPYSTMTKYIGNSLTLIFFPIIREKLLGGNPAGLFLFFSIVGLIGFIINAQILVQTRGKTQYQIRQEYDKRYPKWKGNLK